jgi:signal peptidase I
MYSFKKPERTNVFMTSVIKSLYSKDVYFIIIALVLAFGVLQTTGTVMNSDKPVVSVVSCSMYPKLNVGDVLLVHGAEYDNIQEQDVVVYSVKEAQITVDDTEYRIHSYNDEGTVSTNAGEISLRNVFSNARNDAESGVITVDGQNIRVSEGSAYEINGATVEIGEITGMDIPIVHRVTDKNPSSLETKGDNNQRQLSFESEVRPEQIHGKVALLIPRIGGLKILAMDLIGFNGDKPLVIDAYPVCEERA